MKRTMEACKRKELIGRGAVARLRAQTKSAEADKRISEVERELVMELSAVDNDAYNAAKVASAVVLLRMIADSEDQQVDRRVREAITVLEEYRCAEGDSE